MNIFYYGHFLNGSIIGNTMMTDTSRHKHLGCEMTLQLAGLLLAVGGGGRGDGGRGQDWLTDQRTMCRALTVACTETQSSVGRTYLVHQRRLRPTSPAEEEEDEDEREEDVEHDDQGEERVGDEREAAVTVSGGNCVAPVTPQPGEADVVGLGVCEDDVHGWPSEECCRLQPPATSVHLLSSPSPRPPHPRRQETTNSQSCFIAFY